MTIRNVPYDVFLSYHPINDIGWAADVQARLESKGLLVYNIANTASIKNARRFAFGYPSNARLIAANSCWRYLSLNPCNSASRAPVGAFFVFIISTNASNK